MLTRKDKWIRGLKDRDLRPYLVILEKIHKDFAKEREDFWFELFSGMGLLNTMRPDRTHWRKYKKYDYVYIYALVDPETKCIKYIGRSVHPKRRFNVHMYI